MNPRTKALLEVVVFAMLSLSSSWRIALALASQDWTWVAISTVATVGSTTWLRNAWARL